MTDLVIRWQIGSFDMDSWIALSYSVRLMKRLEPNATLVIVHQGEKLIEIDEAEYHKQDNHRLEGHHYPTRFDINAQEVWMDNDHIMWELPEGWKRWRQQNGISYGFRHNPSVLIWKVNWQYYGWYTDKFQTSVDISSGIWGLPPGMIIPPAIWPDSPEGDDMGWIALHLAAYPNQCYITLDEVNCYQPGHVVMGPKWSSFGTHGVHLVGMNRGWNGNAAEALERIRKEHNL